MCRYSAPEITLYVVAPVGEHFKVDGPDTMSRSVSTVYSTGPPTMLGTWKDLDAALRAWEVAAELVFHVDNIGSQGTGHAVI